MPTKATCYARCLPPRQVFFETSLSAARAKEGMLIECVPLSGRDAAAAPGYFKQAINECDEEWSQHKKLYDTKGSVRGVVPANFAYFDVGFGIQTGFAHQVENETEWKADFGRDVLEGLLDHPDAGIPLARRKKPSAEQAKQAVLALTKRFEPFDWTKEL